MLASWILQAWTTRKFRSICGFNNMKTKWLRTVQSHLFVWWYLRSPDLTHATCRMPLSLMNASRLSVLQTSWWSLTGLIDLGLIRKKRKSGGQRAVNRRASISPHWRNNKYALYTKRIPTYVMKNLKMRLLRRAERKSCHSLRRSFKCRNRT